jgi:hypothetical protein
MVARPIWVPKAHLNFEYFTYAAHVDVMQQELKRVVGFPFNYRYHDLDCYYDLRDLQRHAALLHRRPDKLGMQMRFLQRQIGALIVASKRYGRQRSWRAFRAWHRAFRRFLPCFALVFGLEMALEGSVRGFLSDDDFYKIATTRETATARERRSFLKLALLPRRSGHSCGYNAFAKQRSTVGHSRIAENSPRVNAERIVYDDVG